MDVGGVDIAGQDGGGPDAAASALAVHVFGTLTSVQSSLGADLVGAWHDEEALPAFVAGRDLGPAGSGAAELLPDGVTHKLQSLVVALHTGVTTPVTVTLDLPAGMPSRWLPAPAALEPPLGAGGPLSGGAISWTVTPDPSGAAPQAGDDLWGGLRGIDAAPLQGVGERFLFAQALAGLDLPLRVEAQEDGSFRVTNDSDQTVPAAWVVHVHPGGGLKLSVGALAPGESKVKLPTPKEINLDEYTLVSAEDIAKELDLAGLTPAESRVLVGTWSWSVFHTQGLRLLYLAPQEWIDQAAPLSVSPAPDTMVRAIVGRIEVLTPDEEDELRNSVELAAAGQGAAPTVEGLGVFAEPRLRRTLELLQDPAARALCESLIDAAVAAP